MVCACKQSCLRHYQILMPSTSRPALSHLLAGTVLALLWVPLFWALATTWRQGTYYDYGWLVPVAAGYFVYSRVVELRVPIRPRIGNFRPLLVILSISVFGLGLLVLRAFEVVDVTWRRILVPHAILVAVASYGVLSVAYGKAVARYFLPVLLFAMTAVPLPAVLEQVLVQNFTAGVVAAAAECLRWLGHPIEVHGDLLVSIGSRVEVTAGCSGIRSFQSMFIAGLFFGELYRLRPVGRLGLLLAAVGLAYVTNIARAVVLSMVSLSAGEAAFSRWHDTVGMAAFSIAMLALFLIGRRLDNVVSLAGVPASGTTRNGPVGRESATGGTAPAANRWGGSRVVLITCLLVLVGVELGVRSWFRVNSEPASDYLPAYSLSDVEVERLDLGDNEASEALHYDRAEWIRLLDDSRGRQIEFFWFEYDADSAYFQADVMGHAVEACMRSSGQEVSDVFADRILEDRSGEPLAFRSLAFEQGVPPTPMFVFKARWVGGIGSFTKEARANFSLRRVLTGQRELPGRGLVVLASIVGCASEEEAWEFFVDQVFANSPEALRRKAKLGADE